MLLALDEVVIGACEVFEELHDPREITLARVYSASTSSSSSSSASRRREGKLRSAGSSSREERWHTDDGVTGASKSRNAWTKTRTTGREPNDIDANTMDVEEGDEEEGDEDEEFVGSGKSQGTSRTRGAGLRSGTMTARGLLVDPSKNLEVIEVSHPSTHLHSPLSETYFKKKYISLYKYIYTYTHAYTFDCLLLLDPQHLLRANAAIMESSRTDFMVNALNIMHAFINRVLVVGSSSSSSSSSSLAGGKQNVMAAATAAAAASTLLPLPDPSATTTTQPPAWQWVDRAKLSIEEAHALGPLLRRVLNALLLASYEGALEHRALRMIAGMVDKVLTGYRHQLMQGSSPGPFTAAGPGSLNAQAQAQARGQRLPQQQHDEDHPIIDVAMLAVEDVVFGLFQGSDVEAAEEKMTRAHWLLQTWLDTARRVEAGVDARGGDVAGQTVGSTGDGMVDGKILPVPNHRPQLVYDAVVTSLVRSCISRCGADTIGERVAASRVLQVLVQLLPPLWLVSASSSSSSSSSSSLKNHQGVEKHDNPTPGSGPTPSSSPSPCLAVACVSSLVCHALAWPTESMPDHGVEDILGTVRVVLAVAVGPFAVAYEQAATAAAAAMGRKEGQKATGIKEGTQDQGAKVQVKVDVKEGAKTGSNEEKGDSKTSASSSQRGKRPRSEMTADSAGYVDYQQTLLTPSPHSHNNRPS